MGLKSEANKGQRAGSKGQVKDINFICRIKGKFAILFEFTGWYGVDNYTWS